MRTLWIATVIAAASLATVTASALAEEAVTLAQGPGLDAVQQNCAACHSLDYVVMNSPFQDQKGWTATVAKMINVMGAPIDKADAERIIDYLTANYGKK